MKIKAGLVSKYYLKNVTFFLFNLQHRTELYYTYM